jgi:hypothetical protein
MGEARADPGIVSAGRNTLGAMARELTADEKAQVISFPIAYDGVGMVVQSLNQLAASGPRIWAVSIASRSLTGRTSAERMSPSSSSTRGEGHALREVFMKHVGLTREEMTRYTGVTVGDNAPGHPRVIPNATGSIWLM